MKNNKVGPNDIVAFVAAFEDDMEDDMEDEGTGTECWRVDSIVLLICIILVGITSLGMFILLYVLFVHTIIRLFMISA